MWLNRNRSTSTGKREANFITDQKHLGQSKLQSSSHLNYLPLIQELNRNQSTSTGKMEADFITDQKHLGQSKLQSF